MCSRVFGDAKVWGCPATTNGKSAPGKVSQSPSPSPLPLKSSPASSETDTRPALKMLELSNSMHPQYISFQVFLALASSSYNGISCHGLNMNFLEHNSNSNSNPKDDGTKKEKTSSEETTTSYLKHLKILIHSRKWLRLEFHQCLGVESLMGILSSPMPEEAVSDERDKNEGEPCSAGLRDTTNCPRPTTNASTATEVECLVLQFRKSSSATTTYDKNRHRDFFVNLWTHWKVRKLTVSMDFDPGWTREFCRRRVSMMEELEINPECTWHRRSNTTPVEETTQRTEAASNGDNDDGNDSGNDDGNDNDNYSEENDGTNGGVDTAKDDNIDCWKLFCRELRINHPKLRSLEIRCKTQDDELAYLIDHAIAPSVADSGTTTITTTTTTPSFTILPIETLYFGKWCRCDQASLSALSRVLASSSAKRWKALTMSRGVKLPSRAILLDAGIPLPQQELHPQQDDDHGLLEFLRALKHATDLTRLELGDYILDENEMGALFESLVAASGNIERLSLFSCATISNDVYETVLCGRSRAACKNNGVADAESMPSPPVSYLMQNKLPSLRLLHLPKEASKALCEVLKSNSSIEWINNRNRTKTHEYYLDLNRGGRRILTAFGAARSAVCNAESLHSPLSSSLTNTAATLPPTLWPKVLERASSDHNAVLGLRKGRYCGGEKRRYDVVYFLLRNRILLEL